MNFLKLNHLILIIAVFLTACSHSHHDHLKAGFSDYSHYVNGGGLFVGTTLSPDNRLWRVVPEKNYVYVDYSSDMGKTFSAPVPVNKESQIIKVSGENRPGIVVDGLGHIYVIYSAESMQPSTLYFSVSSDNGKSFSTPKPLSDKATEANSFQGRLVLSSSGNAYVFWHDERNRNDWKLPGNTIYYTIFDGQNSQNLVAQKSTDTLCDCCRIAADFDENGQPVLLARFIYNGSVRDHGLIKLQGKGKEPLSWRATFDEWSIAACPEHGPAISITGNDQYHIVWFTQGTAHQGIFYAYSIDHGEHFSKPLAFGNPEKLPSHPDVMAQGTHVVVTWTEFDGVKTQLMVMESSDAGLSWSKAKSIAESLSESDFPLILKKEQNIFVSWNSRSEGYRLIPVNR